MLFRPTIYLLPLLIAAALSSGLSVYALRRRAATGWLGFAAMTLAVAVWALGYALEIAGGDLPTKIFYAKIQYIGIVTVPVAWLVFALHFAQRGAWLTRRRLVGLLAIPAVTLLLTFTNETHRLIWSDTYLDRSGPFLALGVAHGGWFWGHFAYSYLLLLLGTMLFVTAAVRMPRVYRRQALAVLAAALIPWVGNILYFTNLVPIAQLDLTPFTFTLTSVIFAWSIFRFRLLDLAPVARAAVLEGMRDGVLTLDAQNRIVDMNRAAAQMLAVTTAQAIGRSAAQVLGAQFELLKPDSSGAESYAEITLGAGAAQRAIELRMSTIQDQQARTLGRLLMLRDITQQKQIEWQLHRQASQIALLNDITRASIEHGDLRDMLHVQAERLTQLIAADACYIDLWDETRHKMLPIVATGAFEGSFSAFQIEATQQPWTDTVRQAGQTLVAEDILHTPAIASGIPTQLSAASAFGLPLTNGESQLGVAVIVFNQPHCFSPEEIALGEQAARQIALAVANTRLYQAMIDQHSQLHAMITSSRDGVVLVGVDQRILVINQSALQLTHLPGQPEQWTNRPLHDALDLMREYAPSAVSATETEMRRILTGDQQPGEGEYEVQSRFIQWLNLPVTAGVTALGRLLVLHDVTEERMLDRLRNDLTNTMVHDLRNPLAAMMGSLNIMQMLHDTEGDTRDLLQIAVRSTNRMLGLVNAILDVSRLESGQIALKCNWRSLYSLAEEGFELQALLADAKHMRLINALPPALPPVWADDDLVRRVFQNLIGNAIKFTPEGGSITITAGLQENDQSQIQVAISDTGPGIPEELRGRLFRKFATGTSEGVGSGLGLAFCRLAIEAHGGQIWIESEPGSGTTFKFTLPTDQIDQKLASTSLELVH